jgi:hypothetical protein
LNHYYIYYRVSERNAAEAEPLVHSMQARLACRSGIYGRLLKKCGEPGLWMEVYEDVSEPERFERLLNQAVDEFDLAMFLEGARHTECFIGETTQTPACRQNSGVNA